VSWNLVATIRRGKPTDGTAEVVAEDDMPRAKVVSWTRLVTSMPVGASVAVLLILVLAGLVNPAAAMAFIMVAAVIAVFAVALSGLGGGTGTWHKIIEGRGGVFTALVVAAVLAGGVAEIVPSLISGSSVKREGTVQPYTPLELEGRDVYVAEGCYTCHSQMIRPFLWETARYGEVSTPGESAFDHPFQWGSRRIGPDLARVGGRYPHSWHVEHMIDPRAITPGSIMPPYPHLVDDEVDFDKTRRKLEAMHAIGVPYEAFEIQNAEADARGQAQTIVSELEAELEGYGKKLSVKPTSKMIALIAYLQRLGRPPVPPVEDSADDKGDN
jgi:cytochrome c oxidase cbb3-type subunit I/II